jgi:hypothetical protein
MLGVALAAAAAAAPSLVARGGIWPFVVALAVTAISSVVNLALWNAVAASVAGRDARRWLPRAGACVTAGGAVAGLGAALIIRRAGPEVVPWIAAGLAAALVVVGALQERALAAGGAPGATAPPGTSATAMTGDHRNLLRWLWVAALLEAVVATAIEFRFFTSLRATYQGDDRVVAISLFLGGTNLLLLLLQATVVPRLLVTQNLPFTASVHPVVIGLGVAGLAAAPGFALLATVRTAENVLRAATSRTGQEIALSALPPVPRARWKVLLRGAATPVGAAIGGGALVLAGSAALTRPELVAGAALVVTILWLVAARIAARHFLAALAAPLGMKGVALSAKERTGLDLDTLHRLVDAAGATDARAAALAHAALVRHGGRADEIVGHLDHEDPAVRRALYELAARRPSAAARAELRTAAEIEDDGGARAAAVKALAAHGDAEGVAAASGQAELDVEVRRAMRAGLAQLGKSPDDEARAAFADLVRHDGDWAATIALARPAAIDGAAVDTAVAAALVRGGDARRQAFRAAAAAGGAGSVQTLLGALAAADEDAYAAIAELERAEAAHLAAALAAATTTPEERAALARALTSAPEAVELLEQLTEDEDDDVRDAALRSLAGVARAGHVASTGLAARLVERERDGFVAHVAARRPDGARPALHAAELARATRRALRRTLHAVALETAAAGRDPAPLAAAGRRLSAKSEPMRRRALDVLQEIGKTRPKVLDAVERWLRPPDAAAPDAGADALRPFDPWLASLLAGELAAIEPRLAALRACPFFDELAGRHAAALATSAAETTLAAGATLFRAGDAGDAMYLVLAGELEVATDDGAPPRLGTGSVVGEMALVDASPRFRTVGAVSETRLLAISRAAFESALDRWPDLGMGLLHTLAGRLR